LVVSTLPRITPLPLARINEPFDDDAFLFELKHDGFRALAYIERGQPTRLISRRGIPYRSYDALGAALAKSAHCFSAILDGELVCLDSEGRSQFMPLLRRHEQPVFYCFDVLWLDGVDLREVPLIRRKSMLRARLSTASEHVLIADHIVGRGVDFFRAVCARNSEGIVAKLADSPYRLLKGRSPWIKIRNTSYTQVDGRHDLFQQRRAGR
jgi:bifunctional non-homologous end joining protein LigD